MSKTWYPMVDSESCKECGACVQKCSHGVYDKAQGTKPVVVAPNECVQGCHGCGNLCPQNAIHYFGDAEDPKVQKYVNSKSKEGKDCKCDGTEGAACSCN